MNNKAQGEELKAMVAILMVARHRTQREELKALVARHKA